MKTHRIYESSLEDVMVPVSAILNGVAIDPTTDLVQMAFIPLDQDEPAAGDLKAASWETWGSGLTVKYFAKCLVGVGGAVALVEGFYQIFVKITDSPEVPVLQTPNLLQVI